MCLCLMELGAGGRGQGALRTPGRQVLSTSTLPRWEQALTDRAGVLSLAGRLTKEPGVVWRSATSIQQHHHGALLTLGRLLNLYESHI